MSLRALAKRVPGARWVYNHLVHPDSVLIHPDSVLIHPDSLLIHPDSVLWGYGKRETYIGEFAEFIAYRKRIESDAAREMVERANAQFPGGWGGNVYRQLNEQLLETFRPLHGDSTDEETLQSYLFYEEFHFLRMISYSIPTPDDLRPIMERLENKKSVGIVDYGCGLATRTIALTRYLRAKGVKVRLHLVDIRRPLYLAFLDFICARADIPYQFIEVSVDNPYPELPPHDYCDNVSVMEHIREPLTVLANTDRALAKGGLLLALVDDTIHEIMHISPSLGAVRSRLKELRYQEIAEVYGTPLFQKPF